MAATFVQSAHNSGGDVSSVAVTINGVTSGNKLILGSSAWQSGGDALPDSVSSSPALTWTLDKAGGASQVGNPSDNQQVSIWSAEAGSSTNHTVTATWAGGAAWAHVTVAEFSGVADSSPVDVTASNTGNESDNTPTSGLTASATQIDTLVIGVLGASTDDPGDDPIGIDTPSSYTSIAIDQGAFTICAHSMDYRVPTTADPRELSWGTLVTLGGDVGWSAAVVVYKAALSGVGGGTLGKTLGGVTSSVGGALPLKATVSGGVG